VEGQARRHSEPAGTAARITSRWSTGGASGSGPTRGQMWIDHTTADGGYWPLDVDFLTWYELWLDSTLRGGNGIWWQGIIPRGFSLSRSK
jgi:hypothetical protein